MDMKRLITKARLRFCLRMTVTALVAYALAQILTIPLHGLWVVLTAVVVVQMSVGGSLRATTDYIIGTFGGALYASAIGVLVPHTTPLTTGIALTIAIIPLAFAATLNPSFRVAPFTAVVVLLISTELHEGALTSALYRLLEVALGGAVAVAVSLLVLPDRAHGLGLESAARALRQLARALPELLAGLTSKTDALMIRRTQDEIGRAVVAFQAIADEAKRERMINLVTEPDPAALVRVLLRLRHDLVIVDRSATEPLPDHFAERLGPPLARFGASASEFLSASASALTARRPPPALDQVETAIADYASQMAAIRLEGLTRTLPSSEVERIFALGFALQQLHQDFLDLARCMNDWART
jgi:uncharacterized membrane protein YccC